MDPDIKHDAVSKMYNWPDVAERTQIVYQKAVDSSSPGRLARIKGFAYFLLFLGYFSFIF